ncbi:hypothetical protein EVAR_9356_1 [Eumeta japonica]|uniref:Uncharacterized protein n=1 Tax=Eumeta variegata TaxID=151549 RepID=A0A4C1YQB9_EUMVA|nr:hypothetical protein EVAR_9356_1 [Eumeta japonica]
MIYYVISSVKLVCTSRTDGIRNTANNSFPRPPESPRAGRARAVSRAPSRRLRILPLPCDVDDHICPDVPSEPPSAGEGSAPPARSVSRLGLQHTMPMQRPSATRVPLYQTQLPLISGIQAAPTLRESLQRRKRIKNRRSASMKAVAYCDDVVIARAFPAYGGHFDGHSFIADLGLRPGARPPPAAARGRGCAASQSRRNERAPLDSVILCYRPLDSPLMISPLICFCAIGQSEQVGEDNTEMIQKKRDDPLKSYDTLATIGKLSYIYVYDKVVPHPQRRDHSRRASPSPGVRAYGTRRRARRRLAARSLTYDP